MTAHRLRRLSLSALATAALLAISLLPGPRPARADDFTACLGSVGGVILAGPETVAEILQNPEMLPCLALLEDPGFDALVGVLVGLKADGKFGTAGECKNKLPTLLGDAATAANLIDSTAEAEWNCACDVAVVGLDGLKRAINAYDNLVSSCSAFGNDVECALLDGLDDDCDHLPTTPPMPKQDDACRAPNPYFCGCRVAYQEPTPTLSQCLKEHPDLAGLLNCVKGGGEWVSDQWDPKSKLCVTYGTGQTYQPPWCVQAFDPNQFSCGFGSQCGVNDAWLAWYNGNAWKPAGPLGPQSWQSWSKCVSCDTVANGAPTADGVCGCKNGYQPLYRTGPSGKQTLLSCTCPAPMKEGSFTGLGQRQCQCPVFGQVPRMIGGTLVCACPPNQQLENGLCRACTNKERYDPRALKCIPWQGKPWEVPPPVPSGGLGLKPPDCSRQGENYVNDPRNPMLCVPCGRGLVANENHTACVSLPPGPGRPQGVAPLPARPGPGRPHFARPALGRPHFARPRLGPLWRFRQFEGPRW